MGASVIVLIVMFFYADSAIEWTLVWVAALVLTGSVVHVYPRNTRRSFKELDAWLRARDDTEGKQ